MDCLFVFQIAEVLIGSLSIVISCILLGYIQSPERYRYLSDSSSYRYGYAYYYPYKYFNTGEGIWCGIWVCT